MQKRKEMMNVKQNVFIPNFLKDLAVPAVVRGACLPVGRFAVAFSVPTELYETRTPGVHDIKDE
jgi:hypothetical protein